MKIFKKMTFYILRLNWKTFSTLFIILISWKKQLIELMLIRISIDLKVYYKIKM